LRARGVGIALAQPSGMKRVAPRTTRALAALAALSLLVAGVADGAHCAALEMSRQAMPCCADKVFGDSRSCCSDAVHEAGVSTPAMPSTRMLVGVARAMAVADLPPFKTLPPVHPARGPRVERHAPPPVLRI
jgi:hypothetical protein